jgi:hypothetical protein
VKGGENVKKLISPSELTVLSILVPTVLFCGLIEFFKDDDASVLISTAVFAVLAAIFLLIRLFFRAAQDKVSERAGCLLARVFLIVGIVLFALSPVILLARFPLDLVYLLVEAVSVFVIIVSFDGSKVALGHKRSTLRINALILECAYCVLSIVSIALVYIYKSNPNAEFAQLCRNISLAIITVFSLGYLFLISAFVRLNYILRPLDITKKQRILWFVCSALIIALCTLLWSFDTALFVDITGGV